MKTTMTWHPQAYNNGAQSVFLRLRGVQPLWFDTAVCMLLLAAVCLLAQTLDDRTLIGVSVWTKPFKFALSLAVFFASLAWFAMLVPADYFRRRIGRVLSITLAVVAIAEMAYIVAQAAQGEASHFNVATRFHAMMYSLMGLGATILVAGCAWLGLVIARYNDWTQPYVLAVVTGLLLTFVLGGGFGGYLGGQGGHWVGGAATDAGGVPLFNWSRSGGDLRVAHFFGMHAMQVLPALALLLPLGLSRAYGFACVVAAACAYSAFTTMTFLQALAGRPLFGV